MIRCTLTNEDVKNFQKDGFLIKYNFINKENLNKLLAKFDPMFKGKFSTGISPDEWNWKYGISKPDLTRQICNAWKSDLLIRSFVCHEIVGETLAKLMMWEGSRIIQDNMLWKPPGGKPLGYHQDAAYDDWIIPQTMASCWMTLDDVSKENGTIEYVVGSHKWGLNPPRGKFHSPKDYTKELVKFAESNNKDVTIKYIEVPAGGAVFHHGETWHGSGYNTSKKHRRSIVSHCVPAHAKFHPTNVGGTGGIYKKYMKLNSLEMDESFFPVIWTQNGRKTF